MVDVVGGMIKVARRRRPPLAARLAWMRERRHGDLPLKVMETLVRPGDTVLDIGANWGMYAWRLAGLAGPRGHVHVFEPNPTNRASLKAIQGRRDWVTVHSVALSDHEGEAALQIPLAEGRAFNSLASLSVPAARQTVAHESVPVRLARLDGVLPEGSPRVAFIKCDVEGHEAAVLRGAEGLLRRDRPALLVEIEQRHQSGDIRDTFAYLLGLGYEGYALTESSLIPLAAFDVQRHQLAHVGERFELHAMPPDYVADFLFVQPGAELAPLLRAS